MFARVTMVKVDTKRIQETTKLFAESVIPAARSQRGYRACYLLISNEVPGEGIVLSLWETEEDAKANEASGYYQEQAKKFAQLSGLLFTAPVERKGYNVALQDLA